MLSPQEELQKAIEDVAASRKKVYDLLNENAYKAAELTIKSLEFTAKDKIEVDVQKIRMDGADRVLDLTGFKVQQVNHTGEVNILKVRLPEADGGRGVA